MSGHSKWATTKRAKGAADAKRGAIFTKLANAITVAAKLGGGDPTSNFKLRLSIDQAKAANMPKDNIERAIKKGTGELSGGAIESIIYEGFGPDKIALIIEALTDNRNRTSSSIKHLLNKYGGSLGGPGSVSWLFELRGIIQLGKIDEKLELELIDLGVFDIQKNENDILLYTEVNSLKKIKEFLEEKNIKVEHAEIEQVAKEKKLINQESKERIQKLFNELDENEDINDFYTNAEI